MRKLILLFLTILPLVGYAQNENAMAAPGLAVPSMSKDIERNHSNHVRRIASNDKKRNSETNTIKRARNASGNEPYAVFENGVLTFYCDGERNSRNGQTYDIPDDADETTVMTPDWLDLEERVVKVAFTSSFSSARPITLGDWFRGFTSLTDVVGIEYLNTSKVLHMCLMFYKCSSLTSLDLSHFDTSNVLDMDSMFEGCVSLVSLDVSHFNTSKVKYMDWMFWDCCSLTSLDVSGFDTRNVKTMEGMFGCWTRESDLTSLDVSGFNTSKVRNMYCMFQYLGKLKNLDISGFDTGNVTDMNWMFWGCRSLVSLDLSHFDTSNVTSMLAMFCKCYSLTNLDLSHFNTSKVKHMGWMFSRCSSLVSLDISNFDTSNVRDDYGDKDISNVDDNFEEESALRGMFYECTQLRELHLCGLKTFGKCNLAFMFANANQLKTIFSPEDLDLTNVEFSLGMFTGCTSLVGGKGTKYDAYHTDGEYARIDGGTENPGYFTYEESIQDVPQITLSIKDWDGIMTAFFNSIPNDLEYRLNEKSSTGAMRKVYEIKHSHYPNTIMVSDYPPADGTYTYYVSAAYIDANGEKKGTKSNEVTVTFNSKTTEEKPQFGSIVGRVVFSNASGLELPSVDVDVVFSDDGSKVRVEPNGTFHRDGIPLGKSVTLKIEDDDYYTYKPVTVVVTKDTQNEVQIIEATAREGVDVSVNNNYELKIDNFVNASPEYFEMDVVNTKNQPWTGVINLIAYKKDDAKKVEQLNNSGVSFSTAKPYYIVGSACVEKLSTGASKHLKIAITDFPTLKKDEYYKFYFVSKRSEQSMSMSYKTMSFSDKNLRNPMDVYMIVQEPKYRSEKFPEIPSELDAYLMDVFDIMKTLDKIDGPMGEACQKLAELMEKYERDKNLEGFYGNLPELLKSFKVDLENAVKDVKEFTDIFEKGRKYFNQIKDAYNIIYNEKTKKDEVSLYVKICKKVFELSGDPLSKIYCMYMDILEKSAEKILKLQEELVDAQIDDIFNNNGITFKLRVAHEKEWYEFLGGTRYYSPSEINDRIKDIEIHMVTTKPEIDPQYTQFEYSLHPSNGIESWAAYQVDKYDGDAVVLKRDGSRSSITENLDYTMVRFWMTIRWKNGRVSKIPLYRDCAKWDVTGQGLKADITTTLESTTYNMDDKIYLKY